MSLELAFAPLHIFNALLIINVFVQIKRSVNSSKAVFKSENNRNKDTVLDEVSLSEELILSPKEVNNDACVHACGGYHGSFVHIYCASDY